VSAPPGTGAVPPRPRIFFGWYIVAAGLVTNLVMGAGLVGYVPGVFLGPMTEELGWTRTEFIIAFIGGQFVMAFVGLAIGGLIDRHGGRQLMLWGTAVTVVTLLLTAEVQELWQWWLLRGLAQSAGIAAAGSLVINVALAKWFVTRRGRAIAIAAMGLSLAGVLVPNLLTPVVDELGWRAGWRLLAVVTAVLVIPAALVMRRQPEDHGLLPDGRVAGDGGDEAAAARAHEDYVRSLTRSQALRSSAFWVMVVAFGLIGLNLLALATQAIPFLTDAGFERGTAALMLSLLALPGLLTRPLWGLAAERTAPGLLATGAFIAVAIGMLGVVASARAGSTPLVAASFLNVGSGNAGFVPVQEVLWASLFGRRHLGAVRGVVLPFQLLFGAAGPLALSVYYDIAGSYDGILVAMAGFAVVAVALMQLVRDPTLPDEAGRRDVVGEAAATSAGEAGAGR
jgi:OFA family oxalate/formate antiporter-like MFS transporter